VERSGSLLVTAPILLAVWLGGVQTSAAAVGSAATECSSARAPVVLVIRRRAGRSRRPGRSLQGWGAGPAVGDAPAELGGSPATHSADSAEMVCSNSFGALSPDLRAAGLLQEEFGAGSAFPRDGPADSHAVAHGRAERWPVIVGASSLPSIPTPARHPGHPPALERNPLITVEARRAARVTALMPQRNLRSATVALTISDALAEQWRLLPA